MLEQAQAAAIAWQQQQEQAHARELEVNDLRHRRDTLWTACARIISSISPSLYRGSRSRQA